MAYSSGGKAWKGMRRKKAGAGGRASSGGSLRSRYRGVAKKRASQSKRAKMARGR